MGRAAGLGEQGPLQARVSQQLPPGPAGPHLWRKEAPSPSMAEQLLPPPASSLSPMLAAPRAPGPGCGRAALPSPGSLASGPSCFLSHMLLLSDVSLCRNATVLSGCSSSLWGRKKGWGSLQNRPRATRALLPGQPCVSSAPVRLLLPLSDCSDTGPEPSVLSCALGFLCHNGHADISIMHPKSRQAWPQFPSNHFRQPSWQPTFRDGCGPLVRTEPGQGLLQQEQGQMADPGAAIEGGQVGTKVLFKQCHSRAPALAKPNLCSCPWQSVALRACVDSLALKRCKTRSW